MESYVLDAEVLLTFDRAVETAQAKLYAARDEALTGFEEAGQQAVDTMDAATATYNEAVATYDAAVVAYQVTKHASSLFYRAAERAAHDEYDAEIAAARTLYHAGLQEGTE